MTFEALVHCLTSSGPMSGTGSVKRKIAPVPFRLASSQIWPPWCSTTLRHMASPIPVPS